MRWRRGGNTAIEDRRGMGAPMGAIGGLGGIGVIIYLVLQLLGGGGSLDGFPTAPSQQEDRLSDAPDPDKDLVDFMGFVVDDVQATWADIFRRAGRDYRETKLVIFEDATQTGCGIGQAGMGPFYCPADTKAYLDLSFFRELRDRFGAPGDFAQAYVIAHEFGHHVQNLIGVDSPGVEMELQADCFAGIWGHAALDDELLESGDLEEGLDAAAAIGDDKMQRQAGQRVNPETWTHGSSEQRVRWFRTGFESGRVDDCDTFS